MLLQITMSHPAMKTKNTITSYCRSVASTIETNHIAGIKIMFNSGVL